MRLLSVSPTIPWPPDDGTRNRTWHLLRHVAAHEEVVALTWQAPEDHPEAAEALAGVVAEAIVLPTLPVDRSWKARLRRQASAAAGGLPPFVQALREQRGFRRDRPPANLRVVADRHRQLPFDAVMAEFDPARFLLPDIDAPTVVQRHNVFTDTIAGLRRGTPRQVLWPLERRTWERFDRMATGDIQIATTEESAEALRSRSPGPVVVVPNGADTTVPVVDTGAGRDVVFVGRLDYRPNIDGARWFARNVWPRVHERCPEARFLVIGRDGPESLADLAAADTIITGYVDDLGAALSSARAGVVPLQAGMGIKTKTLDLLARGIPVVATPAGAEGVPAEPGGGVIVAAEAPAMADAVVSLLEDSAEAASRGAAGRALVEERYSWEAAAATYRDALHRLVGAAPGGAR